MAKILVIDTEEGMRQVVARILVPAGHTVVGAENGIAGVEACRRERPDLVIADSGLPDLGPGEFLTAARKVNPRVPVIIMTDGAEPDPADSVLKNNVAGFLSIPFKVTDVLAVVEKALAPPPVQTAPPAPAALGRTHTAPVPPPVQPSAPRKKWLRAAGIVCVCAMAAIAAVRMAPLMPRSPVEQRIDAEHPSGIWCSDGAVWVTDWLQGVLYQYRFGEQGSMTSLKLNGIEPSGITGRGETFWIASALERRIVAYRRDGRRLQQVASYPSPGASPCGLWDDGRHLWSLDFQEGKLFEHQADAALSVVRSVTVPAKNPCGVVMIDGKLYIADTATNRVFVLDAERFTVQGVFAWPAGGTGDRRMTSLGWDGARLWAGFDGLSKLYSCRVHDLKKVRA